MPPVKRPAQLEPGRDTGGLSSRLEDQVSISTINWTTDLMLNCPDVIGVVILLALSPAVGRS